MHELNQRYALELSPLTIEQFAAHLAKTSYARTIGENAAFLLAFDQDADYDGPNYMWHKTHLAQRAQLAGSNGPDRQNGTGDQQNAALNRFFYVDRIVVSPAHQRQGLARLLYQDLFRIAEAQGTSRVLCEVNSDPPNPASDAFHASLGFEALGEAWLPDRRKTVRYLARSLSD